MREREKERRTERQKESNGGKRKIEREKSRKKEIKKRSNRKERYIIYLIGRKSARRDLDWKNRSITYILSGAKAPCAILARKKSVLLLIFIGRKNTRCDFSVAKSSPSYYNNPIGRKRTRYNFSVAKSF